METPARISVCGVVEYRCNGGCGDWIREHEAIWADPDGRIAVSGGGAYCPTCLPPDRRKTGSSAAA